MRTYWHRVRGYHHDETESIWGLNPWAIEVLWRHFEIILVYFGLLLSLLCCSLLGPWPEEATRLQKGERGEIAM